MKDVIKKLLNAADPTSMMRVISLMMVITACLYVLICTFTNEIIVCMNAYYLLHKMKDAKVDLIVINWIGAASFAGAGTASKALQSFAENKKTTTTDAPVIEKV